MAAKKKTPAKKSSPIDGVAKRTKDPLSYVSKKSSAGQFRMAEEASKKKQVRTDSRGRQGMGATKGKKPGMSKTEKMSWAVAPELMALGTALSKAETAARKAIFGNKYAGDPGLPVPKKKRK